MRAESAARRTTRWDGILAFVALAVILGILLAPPHGLLDKADHAAFAVCHRISERSFTFAGRPLPLCARCSGTYLGALAGLIVLTARGRGRAWRLPAPRYLVVLGVFLLAWAVDGLNSFLTFFPDLPHLYEPHNVLRLITGMLEGLAIAAILLPIANLSLWVPRASEPAIESWRDLAWMLAGGAAVVMLVSSEWAPLLYPLALISGLMIVGLVGVVNAMVALIILRREGQGTRWRDAVVPLLLGIALASVELTIIALARAALTERLGLVL
jgi:uncharacterized membrane protein